MTDGAASHVFLDTQGRLRHGDERLLALNAQAGGGVGEPLAVPQLAGLASLASRLEVPVAREIIAGESEAELHLRVRAEPDADGIALAVAVWRERQPWRFPVLMPNADVTFADKAGEGRWETDAAMRLVRVSAEAGERFGFTPAQALGKPLTQLFRLAEEAGGEFPILVALALRQGFAGQRATVRGGAQAVLLDAHIRLDPSGAFAGFDGVLRAPSDAPVAPALTEAFTSRLDGALRAPLGQIVANADSIHARTDGPLLADYAGYAADIASAGRHLLGLIDDLADLRAIERPDFAVSAEPVDLADVARRAAGLLAVRAADTRVRIERPEPAEALTVRAEVRRTLQVLVNLIGNAVRHSPGGGTVSVRVEAHGATGLVTVADQGAGIAIEDHARIFGKFERLDRSEPGGSGLGLYIARRLAHAMGGDVTVESAPGRGALFSLALPLA